MFEMFVILIFIFIMSGFGFFIEKLVTNPKRNLGPFKYFILFFRITGVILHELCHYLMCKLVRVPVNGIRIKYRFKGHIEPHGYVELKDSENINFGQAFLVAFAPLIFSTWLFLYCLSIILNGAQSFIIRLLAFLVCLSIPLGVNPSPMDLKHIKNGFRRSPLYSMFQIFLVILSLFFVWYTAYFFEFAIQYDFIYYLIVYIFYYVFKYAFKIIYLIPHLVLKKHLNLVNEKIFSRKKFKFSNNYDQIIKEAQW